MSIYNYMASYMPNTHSLLMLCNVIIKHLQGQAPICYLMVHTLAFHHVYLMFSVIMHPLATVSVFCSTSCLPQYGIGVLHEPSSRQVAMWKPFSMKPGSQWNRAWPPTLISKLSTEPWSGGAGLLHSNTAGWDAYLQSLLYITISYGYLG